MTQHAMPKRAPRWRNLTGPHACPLGALAALVGDAPVDPRVAMPKNVGNATETWQHQSEERGVNRDFKERRKPGDLINPVLTMMGAVMTSR